MGLVKIGVLSFLACGPCPHRYPEDTDTEYLFVDELNEGREEGRQAARVAISPRYYEGLLEGRYYQHPTLEEGRVPRGKVTGLGPRSRILPPVLSGFPFSQAAHPSPAMRQWELLFVS